MLFPAVSSFHVIHIQRDVKTSFLVANRRVLLSPLAAVNTDSSARTISRLEKEFSEMVGEFASYTDKDITGVENYRYRALYEGVKASQTEPEVFRSFVVLYEDIVPLRLAGRMIYKHLKNVMTKSQEKQRLVEKNIIESTKLSPSEIYEGRKAFLTIDANDDGELSIDELVNSGFVDTIVQILQMDSFETLLKKLDEDEVGKLDFEMFMIGIQRCVNDSENKSCNVSTVLDDVIKRMEAKQESGELSATDIKKRKYNERYNDMVAAFQEWEDLVPEGDGRLKEVLTGCFYGAKNKQIVNALRIVYVDYSALRVSGDLIFKLMKSLVGR